MIITQMLFHILNDPSYLELLRREAEDAIAKHGWSEKIINSLPLQDSFIREINRMYPIFAGTGWSWLQVRAHSRTSSHELHSYNHARALQGL